jgi:hypothetical protein
MTSGKSRSYHRTLSGTSSRKARLSSPQPRCTTEASGWRARNSWVQSSSRRARSSGGKRPEVPSFAVHKPLRLSAVTRSRTSAAQVSPTIGAFERWSSARQYNV